jgi:hypothetical protein
VEIDAAEPAPTNAAAEPNAHPRNPKTKKPTAPRKDSKQAQLIAMLRRQRERRSKRPPRPGLAAAHGAPRIAGALKKKLGLDVQSEKIEGRGRVYRITI